MKTSFESKNNYSRLTPEDIKKIENYQTMPETQAKEIRNIEADTIEK